jgi:uncharacterized protein
VKVVLDTNVILSAFGTRGLCEAVMAVCLDQHEMVLSEAILREVAQHLAGKFKVPAARAREIDALLREYATLVVPVEVPPNACRDADDRAVLGTAVAGDADCLVTGDADLLTLHQFQGIPIHSPRDFYNSLR